MDANSQPTPGRKSAADKSDRRSVERWSNEGGRVLERGDSAVSKQEDMRRTVDAAARKLRTDLSDGAIGQHHNTFQHRSRVQRQMEAELGAADSPASARQQQ